MSKDTRSSNWLVERLEAERVMFEEDTYPLTTSQVRKFESMHGLLKDTASLKIGSSQRQGRRTRVHDLLADIGSSLGAEVFFLCTQATSVTQLATLDQKRLLPALFKWWSRALQPKGLTNVANQLWESYSVCSSISRVCKRTISEAGIDSEQDAPHNTAQSAEQANDQIRSVQVQQNGESSTPAGRHLQSIVDNAGQQSQGSQSPDSLRGQENVGKEHTFFDATFDATTPSNETQNEHIALPQISSNGPDFASAQRAVATFEGVIFYAAESIPGSKEREAWISLCLGHLRVLKQLSRVNERNGTGSKRKRGAVQEDQTNAPDGRVIRLRSTEASAAVTLQAGNATAPDSHPFHDAATELVPQAQNADQVEASGMNMARFAEVDKLEAILGSHIFTGMMASAIRNREEHMTSARLTDAVRLCLPYQEGEDAKLEVWLRSSFGESILQANMMSAEDLKTVLGDCLFQAMEASNRRKEERSGLSRSAGAIVVSFPSGKDSNNDCKLEVTLDFDMGGYIWAEVYPS